MRKQNQNLILQGGKRVKITLTISLFWKLVMNNGMYYIQLSRFAWYSEYKNKNDEDPWIKIELKDSKKVSEISFRGHKRYDI